jgi:large subunit ribosomal protein L10
MASPRILEKKQQVVNELSSLFGCGGVYLFDYRGLKVSEMETLRRQVKACDGQVKVLKDRLAVKYFAQAGLPIGREVFSGPVAVAYADKRFVEVAKVLVDFERESKKIKITHGIIEHKLMSQPQVVAVSKLPSKEVLMTQLAYSVAMPLRKFGSALSSPLTHMLVLLKNLQDKKAKGGS